MCLQVPILLSLLAGSEPVTLWPVYQEKLLSPCQYVGFSFAETPQSQAEMKAAGGEICSLGSMWVPVKDPKAPFGCGVQPTSQTHGCVTQTFCLKKPFCALIVQFPTNYAQGAASVLLWHQGKAGRRKIVYQRFEEIPNEFQARVDFPTQKPGSYALEIREGEGTLGVWIAEGQPIPGMRLFFDDVEIHGEFLEFALIAPEGPVTWYSSPSQHRPVYLSKQRPVDQVAAAGLDCAFMVGNWNNGGFPYYPQWFYNQFPDITMVDAKGLPIKAGIFGEKKGWPGIDHPVIVDGTRRHIESVVKENRNASNLLYWILGGEALYPTYLRMGSGWPDYGDNAVRHFHAWLQHKYGSVASLNGAWCSDLHRFTEARPPIEKAHTARFKDWIEFHFSAMAERMSWHYAAVRASDPDRLALSANHGNLFWADNYAALGADLPQYADATDGFEMGQIMEGDDPGCYNLWYASALAGLGKVGAPSRLAYKFPDPSARGGGTSYTPEAARRYCMEALGAGWWHLGLIQWSGSLPDGEWGIKGTPAETEICRIFSDLKRARPHCEGSWPLLPKIGLFLSKDRWILKDWHPDWTTFHVWAVQHQLDHAILWESQLLNSEAEPYPVLVSLHNDPLSGEAVSAMIRYLDRGGTLLSLGSSLPEHPRIHHLSGSVFEALKDLPARLTEKGVDPFCRVRSLSQVHWALEIEPLTGRHDFPVDLSPQRCVGQSFHAPGPRIRHLALRTPTYCSQPEGFLAILRLRREGPCGEVLAEKRIPAQQISDNAWTGADVDVSVQAGSLLLMDKPIPEQTLGIWASGQDLYGEGKAFPEDDPAFKDLEFKVGYEVSLSGRNVVEAFTLFDGLNFFVPLINVSQEDSPIELDIDERLCPNPKSSYSWRDALSGSNLGTGDEPLKLTVPAKGYRLLSFQWEEEGQLKNALKDASRRLKQWKKQGVDTSYQACCLKRAKDARRKSKAWAHLQRLHCTPSVTVHCFEMNSKGDIELELSAEWPDGKPFRDGVGVLRVVPVPNVRALLHETSPGRYQGKIPLEKLVTYDISNRAYLPYEGGLQGIVNIWKGRSLAQVHRTLR